MNAAETIAAAIEKLEQAKSSHEPGPYLDLRNVSRTNVLWFDWAADILKRDRRTIDAQLAILRDASRRLAVEQNPAGVEIHYRNALILARAILGGVS